MKEADETDRESGYVVLPDEIEGKTYPGIMQKI